MDHQLEVEYTIGTDLEPGNIEEVLAALTTGTSFHSLLFGAMVLMLTEHEQHRQSSCNSLPKGQIVPRTSNTRKPRRISSKI